MPIAHRLPYRAIGIAVLVAGCLASGWAAAEDKARSVPAERAEFRLQGGQWWVVLASRLDGEAAIGVARRYSSEFPTVQVVRAQNGRYAIVVGPERGDSPEWFKQTFAAAHQVPKDLYLSRGEGFVARAWRPTGLPLAHASLEGGNASVTSAGVSATLRVEPGSNPDERAILMNVRESGNPAIEVRGEPVASDQPIAEVTLVRMEGSTPQAVLGVFSGGAHCCTAIQIASKDASGGWRSVDGGTLDGGGPSFEDVDGDGFSEMLSVDNRFLYAFDAYAGSAAPARVEKIMGGQLVDVTRHPEYLRYHRQYLAELEDRVDQDSWHSNGFLAGWMAQKILVGEGADAWARMLQSYDRQSDWGLEVCTAPAAGDCPDDKKQRLPFPDALQKFLDEAGYR